MVGLCVHCSYYHYCCHVLGHVLGLPDPPRDLSYNDDVIIESSVDLQWNRPSYNGGSPIVNYIVSIDDNVTDITTSNEILLTLPENMNDDYQWWLSTNVV